MWVTASLSNRIFLACTLLVTLSIGFAFAYVNAKAKSEADEDVRRGLVEAVDVADQQRLTTLTDTLTRMARLVADLPKLKAAVDTDPPDLATVQPIAEEYRSQLRADFLLVQDKDGHQLSWVGEPAALPDAVAAQSTVEYSLFVQDERGPLQVVSVPILIGAQPVEVLGRLTVGAFLNNQRAVQFKRVLNSDIAFAMGDRVLASSLPPGTQDAVRPALRAGQITSVTIGGIEYLALARKMAAPAHAALPQDPPVMLVVLRPRAEQLRFLNTLQTGLAGALLVAVVLATIVSYAVARTITRPLAAVTGAMGDVAATGDLSRRVQVQSRAWDDEDARLLASAFNSLTESIARFRRLENQRERLSALGRLSTVIAHEIRNPLMIISASLRTLRRDQVSPSEFREAVADIDDETARLNRIVTEVLDFAKPLRFELGEVALNDLCRASAAAATIGAPEVAVQFAFDAAIPTLHTDGERLRTALVNILSNARAAVQAAHTTERAPAAFGADHVTDVPAAGANGITVSTEQHGERVTISVRDTGIGIAPDDITHIFDPYFTTRRAGTGLGLPIAKNIIEGLGGTITAVSRVGDGTDIRIDLPLHAPENSA
jgi:signal transduction histidine kinase